MNTIFILFLLFWRKLTFWELRLRRLKCFTNIKNKDQLWYEPSSCPSLKYCLNVNWIVCLNGLYASSCMVLFRNQKVTYQNNYLTQPPVSCALLYLTKFHVKKWRIFYTWCLAIDFGGHWLFEEEEGLRTASEISQHAIEWSLTNRRGRSFLTGFLLYLYLVPLLGFPLKHKEAFLEWGMEYYNVPISSLWHI